MYVEAFTESVLWKNEYLFFIHNSPNLHLKGRLIEWIFFLNKAKSWRPSRHTHTKQTEIDKQQMVACFGSQFLRIISLAIIFRNFQKFLSKKTLIWEL